MSNQPVGLNLYTLPSLPSKDGSSEKKQMDSEYIVTKGQNISDPTKIIKRTIILNCSILRGAKSCYLLSF